jgi:hypothetical protein
MKWDKKTGHRCQSKKSRKRGNIIEKRGQEIAVKDR